MLHPNQCSFQGGTLADVFQHDCSISTKLRITTIILYTHVAVVLVQIAAILKVYYVKVRVRVSVAVIADLWSGGRLEWQT